jgi:FkbM family methyltransferase
MLYPSARIVGAELDVDNWEMAVANTKNFDNVSVRWCGIADHNGLTGVAGTHSNAYRMVGGVDVACHTIDTLLAFEAPMMGNGLLYIDYLKMDIEGAEEEVLQFGGLWPTRTRQIQVEVHEPYNLVRATNELVRLGFVVRHHPTHPSSLIGTR